LTESSAQPVVRPLTAADEAALSTFTCLTFKEPWTVPVQEMIRERLAENLAIGAVSAVGAWVDDDLRGVAAWKVEGSICHSVLLAVRTGQRRRGIGSLLKEAVLSEARAAGAAAIVSTVHWDNEAMIALNASFGANVERIEGDLEYCRCVVEVPR
jgi:ribosomal protein S18 acetylase RimI-like enzyme